MWGNELFGGYPYYREYIKEKKFDYQHIKRRVHRFTGNNFAGSYFKKIFSYYVLPNLSPLRNAMFLDFKFALSESTFPIENCALRADSLEAPYPLLDRSIIDFSFRLKEDRMVNKGTEKFFLREIFKGKLPRAIVEKSKGGFGFGLKKVKEVVGKEEIKDFLYRNDIKGKLKESIQQLSGDKHNIYALATLVLWERELKKDLNLI